MILKFSNVIIYINSNVNYILSRGGGVVPRRSHKPQTQVQILPPQQMFNQYFSIFKNFELYKDEGIQILLFGFFLLILYFIFSSIINYSLKITKSINEKRRKNYLERVLTIVKVIKLIFKYILIFIFIIFILNKFKINLNLILTSAGVLGATIILIFQNTLRDILSGWIFFFEDIFREGEKIMINNTFKGKIIDFKSRFIVLRGEKGEIINFPYGQINIINNFSRKRIIEKIIIKFKREKLQPSFLTEIEKMLRDHFKDNQNLEIFLNKNFNLGDNWFEVTLNFKSLISLKEEFDCQIKNFLLDHFSDSILELKNES
ncbi:MAG: hypothetical protein KatS3mg095_0611 [Candidatus Parcubacteria bacterium]|nr:MAG: hypothetical protein KatS3mg095_0611 [Candidatus Parcubacteria bacterium]